MIFGLKVNGYDTGANICNLLELVSREDLVRARNFSLIEEFPRGSQFGEFRD